MILTFDIAPSPSTRLLCTHHGQLLIQVLQGISEIFIVGHPLTIERQTSKQVLHGNSQGGQPGGVATEPGMLTHSHHDPDDGKWRMSS
jgi:hypothetical protein